MNAQRWKVLFVDDDPGILDGLRRSLRRHRDEWDMRFVASVPDAFEAMRAQPADIVIADMMMPEMNGTQFLCHIREQHPDTIRFALSGQLDRAMMIGAIGPVHQFLAKPITPEALWNAVHRATRLRERIGSSNTRSVLGAVEQLPTLPDHQRELLAVLSNADASIRDVGEVVARDIGMTAKVMQLVNSAFFGRSKRASGPVEAVSRLGIETVRSLAVSFRLFDAVAPVTDQGIPPAAIWNRACKAANAARQIARAADFNERVQDQAFLAGLLHELGRLVLSSSMASDYAEVLARARASGAPLLPLEQERFGIRQGELTAYLLGLWAFEDEVVDAIMYYECPGEAPNPGPGVLAALHLAVASLHSPSHQAHVELDTAFLDQVSPDSAWRSWRSTSKAA